MVGFVVWVGGGVVGVVVGVVCVCSVGVACGFSVVRNGVKLTVPKLKSFLKS